VEHIAVQKVRPDVEAAAQERDRDRIADAGAVAAGISLPDEPLVVNQPAAAEGEPATEAGVGVQPGAAGAQREGKDMVAAGILENGIGQGGIAFGRTLDDTNPKGAGEGKPRDRIIGIGRILRDGLPFRLEAEQVRSRSKRGGAAAPARRGDGAGERHGGKRAGKAVRVAG